MTNSSEKGKNQYTIAFYNLENLFDTKDDPKTMDDDFTEKSVRQWDEKRFRKKIKKLGRIISNIGYKDIQHPPVILGVAEVENEFVMRELASSKFLKEKNYDYVHFDSPDERGIDTALLYRPEYFKVISKEAISLYVTTPLGKRDFTRDILYVKGSLEGEVLHVLVNHWPSRRAGAEVTNYRRMVASKKNQEISAKIRSEDPNARIIIMGDFNDDPHSESVQALVSEQMYNPMELLLTRNEGSVTYKGNWNLFDQIILSQNFLQMHGNNFRFETAKIFNATNLKEYKGRYKGNPFRTFAGRKYLGGISDHFPVYSIFSIHSD
tara:strand:+ start:1053 stop:2018 length:966 start_codon:yes stop_codon:yes gene_type:complete